MINDFLIILSEISVFASSEFNVGLLAPILLPVIFFGGVYYGFYRYYRNTDKNHDFEHNTDVDVFDRDGSDRRVRRLTGLKNSRMNGENIKRYRTRVKSFRK